jgi:hypothetical protein
MYLEPFVRHFKEIGEAETRTIHILDDNAQGIPKGEYALAESYCTDRKCDCRRVMLNVISRNEGHVASISFGFDPDGPMPGPFLDPINPQSAYAEEFLQLVKDLVLSDADYVARLKRHYKMLKDKLAHPQSAGKWWKKKPRRLK